MIGELRANRGQRFHLARSDLSHVSGSNPPRFDYGVLPPAFFRKVRDQLLALISARRVKKVLRSE